MNVFILYTTSIVDNTDLSFLYLVSVERTHSLPSLVVCHCIAKVELNSSKDQGEE